MKIIIAAFLMALLTCASIASPSPQYVAIRAIMGLAPNLIPGQDYVVATDGTVTWTSGTPDPRATPEILATILPRVTAGVTIEQNATATSAIIAKVKGLAPNVRAALLPVSTSVLALLQQGDIDAAKAAVTNATTNPTGGVMSDADYATLRTQILALFP